MAIEAADQTIYNTGKSDDVSFCPNEDYFTAFACCQAVSIIPEGDHKIVITAYDKNIIELSK